MAEAKVAKEVDTAQIKAIVAEYSQQRWLWHSDRMPANAFDTTLERGFGYQISTAAGTKYSFIGV